MHRGLTRFIYLLLTVCCLAGMVAFASETEITEPPMESEGPQYEPIGYGSVGDDVLVIQTRLMELGYFHDDIHFTPTVFDDGTQKAVESFCTLNGITYTGTGATAALQQLILAEGAVPYAAPEVKQGISSRFSTYMLGTTMMFGLGIPTFAVWIFSAVLIVLILFLLVYFFVPEQGSENNGSTALSAPQYWRRKGGIRSSSTILTQQKAHGASVQTVELQIRYGDRSRTETCVCPPSITIGRENCVVNLSREDKLISGSHCEIYLRGSILMLKDHSKNGTHLNQRLLHNTECRLNNGDQILIGKHELYLL